MAQRFLDSKAVQSIMNKRVLVQQAHVGKKVELTIQGNGTVIDVKDGEGNLVQSITEPGTVLQKKIFNCKANSGVAMSNERNRELLKAAIKAEKAGDAEKAHELYNQYLNAVQLSFGVLLPSAKAENLGDGVDIAARVTIVTTEKGSLLTIDPATINMLTPETLGATSFDISTYATDEETASEGTPAESTETPATVEQVLNA